MSEIPSTPPPDLSAAISKIMEHPELISMVASVLGKDAQDSEEASGGDGADDAAKKEASEPVAINTDILTSITPLMSKLSAITSQKNGGGAFRHEQLLCALKPYLSSSRGEAVDYIVKISKMSSLIKGIK